MSCQQDPKCLSYNYQYQKRANGLCELYQCGVDQSKGATTSLVYSYGFVFQQLKEDRGANSCMKAIKDTSHGTTTAIAQEGGKGRLAQGER
ncbi:hypothetical protein QZH41_000428 [Actinostola sp. cb2023]|nr:hypothetical protein QZH41_000428 [Actinostola sp. cb2023]